MRRKGFPESYDVRALLGFVRDLKAGKDRVASPVYSHVLYDIVPGESIVVERPDIVIVEGLNVLQTGARPRTAQPRVFVSDFFDFSIYVDADDRRHPRVVRRALPRAARDRVPRPRLLLPPLRGPLRRGGGRDGRRASGPRSTSRTCSTNILPTRERADLVLRKGRDHAVEEVWLRKL